MRKIYRLFIICLSTAGSAFVGPALADDLLAPKAAAAFEKSFPDFEVAIVDSLTLKLGPRGHQDYQINLDRIDRLCRATPGDCDRLLHDFVTKVADTVRAQSAPPTLAALRAVVRPADYVKEFKKELGTNGDAFEPISEPVAGDLVALCYLDMPTTMRVASTKDIVPLGLTPATAMQTCENNVKTALKPLQEQLNGSPAALGYLRGDPYESSYFLFHDDWAPLAARYKGSLLVSVPTADAVLYADGQNPDALTAFAAATKEYFSKGERPISSKVFRWTRSGWEIAVP